MNSKLESIKHKEHCFSYNIMLTLVPSNKRIMPYKATLLFFQC